MTPEQARFEALRLACEYTVQTDADQIVADAEKFREFLAGPEITERVVTIEIPQKPERSIEDFERESIKIPENKEPK